MIVTSTAIIQKSILVNGSFTFENVEAVLKAAERDFLRPILGREQLKTFADDLEPTDTIVLEALELAQSAVCNYAYYMHLPKLAVQITDAGIFISNSDEAIPAKATDKNDLLRSYKRDAYKSLDALLEIIEESADKFPDFFNSPYYTKYTSLLVNKTSVFNDYYTIDNSMMTYLKLRPDLIIVEDQFITSSIQKNTLEALKTPQTTQVRKEVKTLLQKACVAFCVYRVLDNGAYTFNGDSLIMKFDVLPWEKTREITGEHIQNAKQNKFNEGSNYLRQAKELILKNISDFPEYVVPLEKPQQELINKQGGIVSF